MVEMKPDRASFPLGRKLATVVSEPATGEFRCNEKRNKYLHFQARGKNGELIDCMAYGSRALRGEISVNVGDEVVVDEYVVITAVDNQLEYNYNGLYVA